MLQWVDRAVTFVSQQTCACSIAMLTSAENTLISFHRWQWRAARKPASSQPAADVSLVRYILWTGGKTADDISQLVKPLLQRFSYVLRCTLSYVNLVIGSWHGDQSVWLMAPDCLLTAPYDDVEWVVLILFRINVLLSKWCVAFVRLKSRLQQL